MIPFRASGLIRYRCSQCPIPECNEIIEKSADTVMDLIMDFYLDHAYGNLHFKTGKTGQKKKVPMDHWNLYKGIKSSNRNSRLQRYFSRKAAWSVTAIAGYTQCRILSLIATRLYPSGVSHRGYFRHRRLRSQHHSQAGRNCLIHQAAESIL